MVRQQPATIIVRGQGLSLRPALLMSVAILALATSVGAQNPRMVWNASASVPVGLYRIEPGTPVRGDLALGKLPPKTALLADERGYLPSSAYLLKTVAATAGDRVCRIGRYVLVSGRSVVIASIHDRQRRALPAWHGCNLLAHGEVFLLGTTSDSFDSRYFGPIKGDHIVGRAMPIWTLR